MMEALKKALSDLAALERRGADLIDADRILADATRKVVYANAMATLELARLLTEQPSRPGNTHQAPAGSPAETGTATPPEPAGSAGPDE